MKTTRKFTNFILMIMLLGILMPMSIQLPVNANSVSNACIEAGVDPSRKTEIVLSKKTYKRKKLTSKQYKAIKGWWSHNSSGGYNIKFTKSGKICYYDRYSDERVEYDVIYKMKKTGSGYMIYLYDNGSGNKYRFKYCGDYMEYYSGWKGNSYSGSSSLFKGKW